jgi:hypothetical protein
MKTRSLVCGALIVAISTLALTQADAQTQPVVKVLPGGTKDIIKVMYCGKPNGVVTVRFIESDGAHILSDKIRNKNFEKGFLKKYKVSREQGDFFWVEVSDADSFVRYKVFANSLEGWSARLEKETYNYPVVASYTPNK